MKITGAVLERLDAEAPYAKSRPLSICEIELAPPGPTEVLVQIESAGVCRSDLSVVQGHRPRPVPMLLGHEAAGIVKKAGSACQQVEPGDRVVMTFLPRCGECSACHTEGRVPCSVGSAANGSGLLCSGESRLSREGSALYHHLGVSAFATHAIVDERSLVKVDPDIPSEIAALFGCAVLTGGGAVLNVAQPEAGDEVIVVGLGGVGMSAALVAGAVGCEVIGVDANPAKLKEFRSMGFPRVHTPQEASTAELQAPHVIEAVGHPRALETAFELTSPGGQTVSVGLPPSSDTSRISPLELVAGARRITGSYLGSSVPHRDIRTYSSLWRQGLLPVEKLVSKYTTLEEINEAMDELDQGSSVRQIISFSS